MINAISNDTLKSYFFKDQMSEIEVNNLTEFRSTFEPYKNIHEACCCKKEIPEDIRTIHQRYCLCWKIRLQFYTA